MYPTKEVCNQRLEEIQDELGIIENKGRKMNIKIEDLENEKKLISMIKSIKGYDDY